MERELPILKPFLTDSIDHTPTVSVLVCGVLVMNCLVIVCLPAFQRLDDTESKESGSGNLQGSMMEATQPRLR
jgi:hypothetical protein